MRIVVLHHPRSTFPLDLRQLVGPDVEIVWAVDAAQGSDPADRLLRRLGAVVDLTGRDAAGATAALAAERPDGILTYVDDNLERTADLARRLDLPYHSPDVARRLADKRLQRRTLAEAGVAGPRFWWLGRELTAGERRRRLDQVTFPAVVKPAHGSGSRGIHRVEGPAGLEAAVIADGDVVVEEYLPDAPTPEPHVASYLSVESVVQGGRARHVAFCGRFPLEAPFRETGNVLPGLVAPGLRRPLLDLVDGAVGALGIEGAVLHTEIKLTPDGPRLVEVNGRLGGRPPYLLADVADVNLFAVTCDLAAGRAVDVPELVACDGVAFWRMVQPPVWARRVSGLEGAEELLARPEVTSVQVHRAPGDGVNWREGTDGCVVTVRGRVARHADLAGVVARMDRTLAVHYDGDAGAERPGQYRPVAATARS